jgi:hypothetical protein
LPSRFAVSLHFAYYNFCRVHASLNKQTPAMAAGVTDHVWTLNELIALLEQAEAVPVKRGRYAKTRAVVKEAQIQPDPLPVPAVNKGFTSPVGFSSHAGNTVADT